MIINNFLIKNNAESYQTIENTIKSAFKIIYDYNAMTPGASIWNYTPDKRSALYENIFDNLNTIEKAINNLKVIDHKYNKK